MKSLNNEKITDWESKGYVVIEDLLSAQELNQLSRWYDDILNGKYDTSDLRSDLSGGGVINNEKITQVMRPSLVVPEILNSTAFKKVEIIARILIGEDAGFDFDMLINKRPYSDTETPWHQDAAYWPMMEDRRSGSFWIAIDDADVDNGCMAYVPGSHNKEIQPHQQMNKQGALATTIDPDETIEDGIISAGSTIVHNGYTLHYAYGNKSERNRRAWIINFRPLSMIQHLRKQGFDHLGKRSQKNKN